MLTIETIYILLVLLFLAAAILLWFETRKLRGEVEALRHMYEVLDEGHDNFPDVDGLPDSVDQWSDAPGTRLPYHDHHTIGRSMVMQNTIDNTMNIIHGKKRKK